MVPALLGTDALGGAVNIITKAEKENFLDASYSIGSFHTHNADLNAQFVEQRTGLIVRPTVGINYSKNDYRMKDVQMRNETGDRFINGNPKRFHDGYFSLLAQIEAGIVGKFWVDELFVSASYSKTDKELQTGSVQTKVYGMAERNSDAWNVSARYNKRNFLTENMTLKATLSHTWDHSITVDTAYRKYYWDGGYIVSQRNEIRGGEPTMRHYKRPLTIVRANLDYQLNEHHGFNLNYNLSRTGNDRYDDLDQSFEPSNDAVTKHIVGLTYSQSLFDGKMQNVFFAKDYVNHPNIRQTDQSTVTGSDKVQGSTTKNYLGYGAGLRYTFFNPLAVKISYEHSVRLPIARELLGNGTTVYANVALEPEKSNNVNLALFGTWRPAAVIPSITRQTVFCVMWTTIYKLPSSKKKVCCSMSTIPLSISKVWKVKSATTGTDGCNSWLMSAIRMPATSKSSKKTVNPRPHTTTMYLTVPGCSAVRRRVIRSAIFGNKAASYG